jgi:hypothetical protein
MKGFPEPNPAEGVGAVGDVDSDTNPDYEITADDPGSLVLDLVYATPSSSDFTAFDFGAEGINAVEALSVQFWANSGGPGAVDYPASLEFYFLDGGGTYWVYDIDVTGLSQGWNALWADISQWSAGLWDDVGGGGNWLAAIADVDEVGMRIGYQQIDGQEYGIDNFRIHYPEPGTYAVLAFALMSLGITFRGKIKEGISSLRSKS